MTYVTIVYPTAIAWDSGTGERITGPAFEEFKRRTAAALKRSMKMSGDGVTLTSMQHPDGPAVRLLKRYGFTIEYADTCYEETVAQGTIGAPIDFVGPDDQPRDMLHFMSRSPEWRFLTREDAEAAAIEEFKTFLLEAKKRGHDTYFSRAILNTRADSDYASGRIFWRAFLRGSTWKA